jgi:hypothetical protein
MSTKDFSGGKTRPARKAENLAAMCELTGILDISQPHVPPRPVMGIVLLHFMVSASPAGGDETCAFRAPASAGQQKVHSPAEDK